MMKEGVLRWGICCAGRVCHDFVVCLNSLPETEHKVVAVAARDHEKAQAFAKEHSITTFYSDYAELTSNSDIDIVYIGAIHTEHFKLAKMMLNAGKHVLCEKPICVTAAQTKSLFAFAKLKNLFLMEGFWSRCFPAYQKIQELIKSGIIGEVRSVFAQFGKCYTTLRERMRFKDTAGGALFDIGVYPLQLVQFVYNEPPIEQYSHGSLLEEAGVDSQCDIFLRYPNNRTAAISTSLLANLPREGMICGTKGIIKVCYPFWCPTRLEVSVEYGEAEIYEFSLPSIPDVKLNFKNSEGFVYEAMEVRKCILKGLTESSLVTPSTSIEVSEIINKARLELGYTLPQDKEQPS